MKTVKATDIVAVRFACPECGTDIEEPSTGAQYFTEDDVHAAKHMATCQDCGTTVKLNASIFAQIRKSARKAQAA